MKCDIYGENSIIIFFENEPCDEQTLLIHQIDKKICNELDYVIDSVASYTTLVIFYAINQSNYTKALKDISSIIKQQKLKDDVLDSIKHHKIYVCYDDVLAPDLNRVLQHNNISKKYFIKLHTQKVYTVYSVGFMANFAYLGVLENKIATPRLAKPRNQVLSGSVGIAKNQTGVYPTTSPGGWNIVGRTPQNLQIDGEIKFTVGDKVEFIAINIDEYKHQGGKIAT